MPSRRIACLLLGLWLGAGLWMQWVAAENVASVDDLLLRPSADASAYLKTFGHMPISPLAQYLAAEQNRSLFETWGMVQIGLSAVFFFFVLFGTRLGKVPIILALLLFLVVLGERALVIPQMNTIARATDFAVNTSRRVRLERSALGYGYTSAEVLKWLLAAGVSVFLVFQKSRRSVDTRHKVDLVNKANYGHIDR